MNEDASQLGALQVDRESDDGVSIFLKKPGEFYEAGKKWKEKDYENKMLQIAHHSTWIPANSGKQPAVDFFPRMQALPPIFLHQFATQP